MVDIKLYGVSEIGWLVAQSKNSDFNYLKFSYHEGSTAGRTTFITNNIKNSDIHTIMSHVYNQCTICGIQGKCDQKYRTESSSVCLCNSQYIYGQSINTKICCTQQSAHSCQVSNSSLDIQRSMLSLSGSFLRSSANFSKPYNDTLCTGCCRELINGEMLDIRCFHKYCASYNKQNQGYAGSNTSSIYFEKFNGIIAPKGLAACHSHDSQHLYSKQEQSFSDKSNFNGYGYISQIEQFSYEHDIMNKSNMFSFNLLNETSWSVNDCITVQKSISIGKKSPLVNTIDDSLIILTERTDRSEEVHRSYGFIPLTIPEHYCATEGSQPEFEPTSQWLQKIHEQVSSYGVPNYKGARIRVPSTLNVKAWRQLVENYDYKILAEYIEFGFPMNIDYDKFVPNKIIVNHKSANCRPEGVNKYFQVETSKHAMLGPFNEQPFETMHFSPLMAHDKPDGGGGGGGVRVIVELSWPLGQSVNSCITPNIFDDVQFKLKYPTIDSLVEKINAIGPNALLYKIDLERAF